MSADLPLTFACGLYDRMLPLYTGDVRPAGIDLKFIVNDVPSDVFSRMHKGEFDASEMSSSEFVRLASAGECPFVAIPVFPSRVFRHGLICVNRQAGIKSAKDLEGKRIGVPLYPMTAAVWIRGHLQHEYGVDLSAVRWLQEEPALPKLHGAAVHIDINRSGKTLSELLARGDIDAHIGAGLPDSLRTSPDVVRLFPNYRDIEREFYRQTQIFPIMHAVVIRRDVHEKHPFVAASLYDAFCRSKEIALSKMRYIGSLRYMLPWMTAELDEIDEVFGGDPFKYGIEPNRKSLEALITYLTEQSLIAQPKSITELFVPVEDTKPAVGV
jgi:4,5-dihydroxyphthalate decarboxylase